VIVAIHSTPAERILVSLLCGIAAALVRRRRRGSRPAPRRALEFFLMGFALAELALLDLAIAHIV
jgi:hypothetical protein